jgi:hypothetical protein
MAAIRQGARGQQAAAASGSLLEHSRRLNGLGPSVNRLPSGRQILREERDQAPFHHVEVTFAGVAIMDDHWGILGRRHIPGELVNRQGGSIDGMIAASDANLAAASDDTIIIAGHGKAVGTKAELREFRDMLVAVREKVAALKKEGRSRDDTVAAKPTAAFDAKFGNFVIDPAFFTRLVYEGV